MTDAHGPDLSPAMQPEVEAVVDERLRRGWHVKCLSRDGEASDFALAYVLVRQVHGEAHAIILGGPDSSAALRTTERTCENAEDAKTVIWSMVGPAVSMLGEIDRSVTEPSPYPRPEDTRVPQIAGASWRWLSDRERRRNQ